MIKPKSGDEGKVWVSFQDWTEDMVALSSKLHMLPDPPGEPIPRNHEVGIDKLSKLKGGKKAVDLLWRLVDDLQYRPEASDVIRMGQLALKADAELETLLAKDKGKKAPAKGEPKRKPDVPKTLGQTKRQLREWDIYGLMLGEGRLPNERAVRAKYDEFVKTFYGLRNILGQVILDYPGKARYWSIQFLINPRFDIQDAIDPRVDKETKTETKTVINFPPSTARPRPDKVELWSHAWSSFDRHREEVTYCLDNLGCLNEWERDFLTAIADKAALSPRQAMTVQKLVGKVARGGIDKPPRKAKCAAQKRRN